MAKQAQFTSDKTVFNETLDFPKHLALSFLIKKMKLSILVRQKT